MPKFSVNSYREDPYRNFKFVVSWDNEVVAGLSKCSALKKTTDVVDWREGGDSSHGRKIPGMTKYEPITLEAGVTHDTRFEDWANLVNNYQGDPLTSLKDFRKDVMTITVRNLQGMDVLRYNVYRCWVSEYQAMSELDASGNGILISTLVLQNEGWERDMSLTEPTES